jgi:CRISPR/Cas system-associated exonuclease Cas4 (RecB family)
MITKVSYTQIAAYLRCSQMWAYRYKLGLKPPTTRAQSIGKAVHAGLAAGLDKEHLSMKKREGLVLKATNRAGLDMVKEARKTMLADEVDLLQARLADAGPIAVRAFRNLEPEKWRALRVFGKKVIEWPFKIQITKAITFVGFIDYAGVHLDTEQAWLFEWKVRNSMPGASSLEFSLQHAAYQYALQRSLPQIPLHGSMEYCVRSILPKEPKVTKEGAISRADCMTDWETYRAAIVRNGLDPNDYLEMKAKLDAKGWTALIPAFRPPELVRNVWHEIIVRAAKSMAGKKPRIVRSLDAYNCNGCQFSDPCTEELRGRDPNLLTDTGAQIKEAFDDKQEEEED